MNALDFIVIGAQKCATTTLFELLRQHPDVALPLEKELPLFTDPAVNAETLTRFQREYLPGADEQLRGKVSPQYMADSAVPARIASLLPGCKLIAVLRDPLERTRSHFRMGQRRGTESRGFTAAVESLLAPQQVTASRSGTVPMHRDGYESEGDYYLAWSEYGRILASYREHFPARQMLVIYSEELKDEPQAVLDRVLDFLGLDKDFSPAGLGDVMHAGGGSNKIPHGLRVWLRELPLFAALWQRVPTQQQGRLRFLYERWNTHKQVADLPLPPALETRLRQHFAADLAQLERLGIDLPAWLCAYAQTRDACAAACHGNDVADGQPLSPAS